MVGLDTVVGLEPEWSVELLTLEPEDHGRSSVVGLDTVVGLEPEWSGELLTLEPEDHG